MNIKIQFIKIIILLVFIVSATTPVFVFAESGAGIKPGSFLYFFDTTFEKIGMFFAFSPEKKAEKALLYADERLAEAKITANENNSEAVATAMAIYQANISLATSKSKEIEDEKRAEELLNTVSENTAKHQDVLGEVLGKVPDEAKDAILKAIEVSKRGHEEALREITALKEEVAGLKENIQELKDELKDKEKEQKIDGADNGRAEEIEELKKKIERLEKKSTQLKPELQETKNNDEREEDKNIVTLPSGAVVEMDEDGNIIRTTQEDPKNDSKQVDSTAIKITSINITPGIDSVKIEWTTNQPTESKVFLSGGSFPSKVFHSESGLSTRHAINIDGLNLTNDIIYFYEIEAIESTGKNFIRTSDSFTMLHRPYSEILSSIQTKVNLNPHFSCDKFGFNEEEMRVCKYYQSSTDFSFYITVLNTMIKSKFYINAQLSCNQFDFTKEEISACTYYTGHAESSQYLNILNKIRTQINLNSQLSCNQLGFTEEEKLVCQHYKNIINSSLLNNKSSLPCYGVCP